jgi:hypothetical protein
VLDGEHACGFRPLRALLLWARGQGLTPRLLDARNSGDTAGDRHRVVGYAAVRPPAPQRGRERKS